MPETQPEFQLSLCLQLQLLMWSLMRARCYQVWTRDAATRLRPDLHLIPLPASDWPDQGPGCLLLANRVPLTPGSLIWSLDLICVVQTDKSLSLHTVSTLLSHSQSVTRPSLQLHLLGRGDSSPIIGFLSQHSLDRCPKFVEKINDRGVNLFLLLRHDTSVGILRFLLVPEFVRQWQC